MNRNEFINEFKQTLIANHIEIKDAEEIAEEYEQHFDFKTADGYSEEQISAKLGDPITLANQFTPEKTVKAVSKGNKFVVATGLFFADLFSFITFTVLFAWVIVTSAISVTTLTISGFLLFGKNMYSLLPSMPYSSAILFAFTMIALSLLSIIGAIYFFLMFKQLLRAYIRWHHNVYAQVSNKPVYPSLSKYPQLDPKVHRRLRSMAMISLIVFFGLFIATFVISCFSAGSIEFWHAWNWFRS